VIPAAAPTDSTATAGPTTAPGQPPKRRISPISLDPKNRNVGFDAEVCQREVMLEFLICRTSTKEHESIMKTDALPSHIHAGLLALGLTRGKPARWSTTREGVSRFGPPQGPELEITLKWTDKNGVKHTDLAGDWLKGVGKGKLPGPKNWIFVGSEMLPDNTYAADINGEVVSVSNFSASLIDVPFKSSKDAGEGNEAAEYSANTKAIPPVGTKVRVTISPRPDAEKSPHARILVEIDKFGRIRVDGAPIAPGQLRTWARQFAKKHPRTLAVIRAEARTIVHDVEEAREELGFAGIEETERRHLMPKGPIPPRTVKQARAELARWTRDFRRAEHLLMDPVKEAAVVLRQIDAELAEMRRMKVLWEDYAAALRKALQEHKATTQPAGRENPRRTAEDR